MNDLRDKDCLNFKVFNLSDNPYIFDIIKIIIPDCIN